VVTVSALVAVAVSPARAAVPDSAGVTTFAEQLKNARYARIGIGGTTYVLVAPKAVADGLAFEKISGNPEPRPADTSLSPPSSPVPWSRLERVEAGEIHRAPNIFKGVLAGALVGGLVLVVRWSAAGSGAPTSESIVAHFGIPALAGGILGGVLTGPKWRLLQPVPDSPQIDTRQPAEAR